MSKWRSYGQALHPKEWWEIALLQYIKIKEPDKIKNEPKVISVSTDKVMFGMKSHFGLLHISKKTIIETITPELN